MHQLPTVWRHEAATLLGAERFLVELHRLHATAYRQVRTHGVISRWNRLYLWCHAILLIVLNGSNPIECLHSCTRELYLLSIPAIQPCLSKVYGARPVEAYCQE